jgi:hypothetical protein
MLVLVSPTPQYNHDVPHLLSATPARPQPITQVMGCLLGVLAVDFDVGTGGVLMHPDLYGCQFPAAYLPAPGTPFPSTGMTLAQRGGNLVAAGAAKALTAALGRWGPLAGYRSGLGLSGGDLARCKPLLLLVNYDFALGEEGGREGKGRYSGVEEGGVGGQLTSKWTATWMRMVQRCRLHQWQRRGQDFLVAVCLLGLVGYAASAPIRAHCSTVWQ